MDTVRFTNGSPPPAPASAPVAARVRNADPTPGGGPATAREAAPPPEQNPAAGARMAQDSARELDALLERVAAYIDPEQHALSIEVREELGRTVVSVYDTRTEELVRQIPPEELLRIATVMRDLSEQREQHAATGLLLDERA